MESKNSALFLGGLGKMPRHNGSRYLSAKKEGHMVMPPTLSSVVKPTS